MTCLDPVQSAFALYVSVISGLDVQPPPELLRSTCFACLHIITVSPMPSRVQRASNDREPIEEVLAYQYCHPYHQITRKVEYSHFDLDSRLHTFTFRSRHIYELVTQLRRSLGYS